VRPLAIQLGEVLLEPDGQAASRREADQASRQLARDRHLDDLFGSSHLPSFPLSEPEARKDDAFEAAQERWRHEADVEAVREQAGRGCSEALELIRAGLAPEEIRRFAALHVCGGLRAV